MHESCSVQQVRSEDESAPISPKDETPKGNKVTWAANKRFKILKIKFKFPIDRTFDFLGLVLGCIEANFCK